jgi:hypothetical protein
MLRAGPLAKLKPRIAKTKVATQTAHKDASRICAVLRDRVSPAFRIVTPAIARGMSRMSGSARRKRESGVTLAPPFGEMFTRDENESYNFDSHA